MIFGQAHSNQFFHQTSIKSHQIPQSYLFIKTQALYQYTFGRETCDQRLAFAYKLLSASKTILSKRISLEWESVQICHNTVTDRRCSCMIPYRPFALRVYTILAGNMSYRIGEGK